MTILTHTSVEQRLRPNLTRLAQLMVADQDFGQRVVCDPVNAACTHPYYPLHFDDYDRNILSTIGQMSGCVEDFLYYLADAVGEIE